MSSRRQDFTKLSPAKQKLLLARLRKQEAAEGRAEGIPPSPLREAGGPYPLSFAQQRLWFIDRMAPGTAVYNVADALVLTGRLDIAALERTLGALVARHEALRTVFDTVDGRPVQRVVPAAEERLPVPVADLAGLPPEIADAEARRLAEIEVVLPFDVPRGPHLRARLIRLPGSRHLALLTMHHIVSDGWSMGVLVRELGAFYRAFAGGEPAVSPSLPPLPIQYPDFADWQRRTLQGETLEGHLRWWRERLAGAPPTLDLPADHPRPPVQRHRGAGFHGLLPPEVSAAASRLARERGATPFMVLLAALALHLARHAGQDDVVVGSPVANRNRLDTEGLLGFFVNTLVLRVDAAERPGRTFLDLLDEVRGTTLGAYAHQDLPFERLVEALKPERDLSRPPLFQVLFALQNAPVGELELPGLTLAPLALPPSASVVDLALDAAETPEGIVTGWRWDVDLFEEATVRRMAARFEVLLAAAVEEPGRVLEELPWLAEAWDLTPRPPLPSPPLPPGEGAPPPEGTTALLFGEERWTYGQLSSNARCIAHRLLALDTEPEARVGICLERSPEWIAAMLGALAAGLPFVPLDPAYPADRLSWMAADAGLAVLLTSRALDGRVPVPPDTRVLFVEEDAEVPARPLPRLDPERLAYVLYTSGSTGRPKGVMVPHRGLGNLAAAKRELLGVGPESRFLQFASPSFDASVAEVVTALAAGASLRLASREELLPGPDFARRLASWGITHTILSPSALAVTPADGLPDLVCVTAAGEPCPPAVAARWAAGRLFLNAYGPTEGTVCATAARFPGGEGLDGLRVPIGVPLAGIEAFVVDALRRLSPPGVPGELWIGGIGLARGYHGRPDLTAERFVPHPFAAEPGSRLYRTGDLVRLRPDGLLDYLGRIDRQVKVRGVRIEPGEIEGILAQHPGVHEVAVGVRPHAGGPRLVAWLVAEPEIQAPALRAWAASHLPEALVPAAFVAVPEMPLTPAGKVDRDALADPGAPSAAAPPALPRAGLESAIAEIWREVLGVEQVGRQESFFDLGGHSLLLVEVQSRLRDRLGREVPILDLFRHSDVAALARHLAGEGEELLAPLVPRARPAAGGSRDVAVIGLACRFPQAPSAEAFWENLRAGIEAIRVFSVEELAAAGVDPALLADPAYVRASGVLDEADRFDAPFFDISPREAQILDPQHRVLLECAAEALERAGHGAGSPVLAGKRVGVFAGTGMSVYGLGVASVPGVDGFEATLANDKDFIATRIAYELDLRGPALTVQTACSTSLVAVHLACKALLDGECELALAGGVTIQFPQDVGYLWREGGIVSPDGHNRAFDAQARGTVGGNGAGLVVLKPLAAALADGDSVLAVIKATALNNDGSEKIGFSAPSERGQAEVIVEAQELAGVPVETIGYVEAHGSATPLGDPIEVAALQRAFRARAGGVPFPRPVALGSVKTNVGHTGSAAGIAGLIKTVLALRHREIPPSLWFEAPNPRIDFAAGPFQVATALTPWEPAPGVPRRAGVSSFGLGGTNAHAIVEEAPEPVPGGPGRSRTLLALSARTPTALEAATDHLAVFLRERPDVPLADVAFTLATGRKAHEHRRIVVAADALDAAGALAARDPRRVLTSVTDNAPRPVAFVLAGLGEQYPGLARGLYQEEPVFREELDRAADLLAPHLGLDLREALFSGEEEGSGGLDLRRMLGRAPAKMGPLDRTEVLQPSLFAVEYALARLWMAWGIVPEALIGYSLGEYVAACLAGVFSLEGALRLVAERARWIGELPAGAMLAVPLPEDELRPWIAGTELDLAATNGPRTSVVSGSPEAVEALEAKLGEAGHPARRLRTTHAFHSRTMQPVAAKLAGLIRDIGPRPPRIPLLSNVTGTWMTGEQAADPQSWADHLLRPVRFAEGIAVLWSEPGRVLLEIGPGQSLSSLALQHPAAAAAADPVALPTLPSSYERRPDLETALATLGKLWLAGVAADWRAVWAREERRRVELPTYPFERQRYWLQGEAALAPVALPPLEADGLDELAQETEALLETLRSALSDPEILSVVAEKASALSAILGKLQEGRGRPLPLGGGGSGRGSLTLHPRPGLRTPYAEPATELESMVTGLWQRLLGLDRVGRHDSFFDLGGDSLLATQALTRVRDAFGVDIPLPALFEDPTPAGTAVLIEKLRGGGAAPASVGTIPRQPRDGRAFPTSFAQERLWVIDQIEPGGISYNLPVALRLRGRLDADVLARAFAEIVRRHETLRTTFAAGIGGPPVQIIHPAAPVPVPWIDLAALPAALRDAETRRLAIEEGSTPFDLARGPVLRIRLLRLAAEEHALLLTLHHIASDGWSSGVLVGEIAALYDAFGSGRPSPLQDLPVQYADYAAWQRQAFQGEEIEAALAWWSRRLADAPVLELPADRPRPPVQGSGGGMVGLHLPGSLGTRLEALARQEGATLFMAVAAVFQALLGRLGGQEDLTVGTPVANRHHREVEGLIGFFVNTLVLRTDLTGDPPFRELLGRVREGTLAALAHGQVPFSQVVEAIRPERSLSHTPLFQVMIQLANVPSTTLEVPGLRFSALEAPLDSALFDLNLTVGEVPGGLNAGLEYRTDLFDRTTAERLLERYAAMLASVAEAPEVRLSELPLLSAAERQALLYEWAGGGAAVPETLELRITTQAARAPEAPALVHNGQTWSFREIHERAMRLAGHLRRLGIGPGSRVGISAERSPEMVEAVLATLLAGAAYVPFDPAYPVERLALMREDAGVALLLEDKDLKDLKDPKDTKDEEAPGWAGSLQSFGSFGSFRSFDSSLAYILYTSGSTGRPKGVAMTRGALANLLAWQEQAALPGGARTLQYASLSFDVSFQEIVSTWITGGTLILVDEETRRDPFALLRLLERERVERLFLPFVALRQLAEATEVAGGSLHLRDVVTAGEQLQVTRAVRGWLGRMPGVRLHNQYGPTESHVVTALTLGGDPESWPALPSIGRPLPGAPVRILDARLQMLPPGVRGELYIGGVALAQGYLDRPDLTAEQFVPDPWGAPGARLYRTGDLARWRSDGTLEYLGRRDHQVKIRGVRVEPGEVEAVLEEHPDVRQAVVLAMPEPGAAGALRLAAWCVGRAEVADLRAFLQDRLPAALVPSVFAVLEAFPVTPSGKVDRLALSRGYGLDGLAGLTGAATASTPPRTETEQRLAAIWRELLGVAAVGVEDNFFELGGHSLLATQLVARIRETFQREIAQRVIFEAPTLGALALAVEPAEAPEALEPLVQVEGDGPFPLSFAQERLWLVDQIEPGSPAYNMPAALRLTGPLRPEVLAAALGEVVRRHATLRTTFGTRGGVPVQLVAPPEPFVLPLVDLSALPAAEPEARRLAASEALRPFDLELGPVLRASLLRLGPGDHVLLCTQHHIATDGWSLGIFVREILALYAGSPLPPLPLRYADYAVWQRRVFQEEALAAALAYWRQQLAGVPVLELPTDRPRSASPSAAGAAEPILLPPGALAALSALARREGATLFMVLMAGFQALLARHTGQSDVAVGTPVAGRDRMELEGLIGFFVNTLVVRTDLAGEPSFRALLGRVRETALAAFAHQQLPFEKLVGELNPERSLAHTPFFQVQLVLQNAPGAAVEIPGLAAVPFDAEGSTAKFDLTLSLAEMNGQLGGGLEYRTALFDTPTIRRLLGHLARLLTAAPAEPGRAFADLPLFSEAERHQLLEEWSRGAAGPEADESLATLFARQVEATPDAPALEDATGVRLSYRELENRSRALARHLRAAGVGPEVPVGLCLERSAERVVVALAVILAGGAYVPLDPAWPEERRALLLEDTGAVLCLSEEKDIKDFKDNKDTGNRASLLSLQSLSSLASLAYLMYTSGSTGRPKGVAVPHRGIARLAQWAGDLGIGPGDTVLQLAPFAFDASTLEVWGALLNGARVVVPAPGALSLEEIGDEIERHGVTVLWLTAGLFHQMVERELPRLAPLRLLLAGGDALSVPHVHRVLEALPGTRLVNGYGPTENTTFTTCAVLDPGEPPGASVPLGRPIHGTRIVLLDGAARPVPLGVPGELYTGGDGLARGYLNRTDLTAAAFVPDPWPEAPGGRLYRTGDRARFLPDGRLEFLGRIDQQVKIRGFRVEPGEIETLLASHPEVREAAVVVGQDAVGKRLVACVVLQAGSEVSTAALRAWLAERLPEPMVPAVFAVLDELPLTPNGKVDRRALTREPRDAGTGPSSTPPRTETERRLAAIWRELLGVPAVGVEDDFFALGGHSLLATQLVSRLRETFGREIALRAIFEAPTLGELARVVDPASRPGAGAAADLSVPLERVEGEGPFPLSFAQERLWLVDQIAPGGAAYNIPAALRLGGPLRPEALAAALGEVVRRHATLRTTYGTRAGLPVQIVAPPEPFVLPLIDLSALPAAETEARRLAASEALLPFDLATGPVLRASLLRLAPESHVLLSTQHHIASDGWSLGIFVREVFAPTPLPELPLRYADYAVWQRRAFGEEALAESLAYWREQLAGVEVLELPADRPRSGEPGAAGAGEPFSFPAAAVAALHALARQEGATLFMVLVAGFQAVLARWSGQTDVAVGTPVAGRDRTELEGIIGFFVNTLVLRTDVADEPSFRSLVRRVRGVALAAFAHRELPFAKLVGALNPERSLAHAPLFECQISLQNTPGRTPEIPGLTAEPFDTGGTAAQLDVSLSLAEGDGLEGGLVYRTALFDAVTIRRLLEDLAHLLTAAPADPDRSLAALPLLGDARGAQVVTRRRAPRAEAAGTAAWEAPRTPTEERLAGLWSALLGTPRPGRQDDFFALGGHSLLATQLVSRIRESLGVKIPLRTLFEAPTLAAFAARLDETTGGTGASAILPVPRDAGPLPLSFAQERLWFLDELDPGTPTLNMPFSARMNQPLDDALLGRALSEIVRRHEVLRTTFGSRDGRPFQVVAPGLPVPLPVIDLRGIEPALRDREAFRLEVEEGLVPFDLARGPLLRARVLRLDAANRLLLVTVHHIVADGWSLGLLRRELRTLYAAFAAGRPSPLPELPVQYADYAAWQRERFGGAALEAEIAWWRAELGDPARPLPVLDLPADRPRPAVQTWRGGAVTHRIGAEQSGRLAAFGRREGATLFMVLLAGFQALLGRLAGQDDVVVGSPVAGRVRTETEPLIGCFLNNLALRTRLDGGPGFRALLARVRTTALGAFEHQDVPFERLLEELRVERDLSRTPLFQVFLNVLNFPIDGEGLAGDDGGMARDVPSKFDLTIYAAETAAGLHLELVYNADLYDRERMVELAAQLEQLLAGGLDDPETPVAEIPLLTPAARAVLPDPSEPLPRAWLGPVAERVAEHARRHPAAIAAVDRSGAWTYAQLDEQSRRLAQHLAGLGVEKGDVVAVVAHRGAALAAALLGIWRAGAAFAILDPAYPPARLTTIVDLARPRAAVFLLAAGAPPEELKERLAGLPQAVLPEREPDWWGLFPPAEEDSGIETGPDDLAYVAFTSGSTGVPKAILGSHAPLSHFFHWHVRTFGLSADDRFSVLSGLAHDPLLRDLFAPLWAGAALCVPDPDTMAEPGRLAAWMARENVTVAHLTPAMGQVLGTTQDPDLTLPLRRAFFGGDVLTGADVARLRTLAPGVEVVNFYGATETPQAMGWAPSPSLPRKAGEGATAQPGSDPAREANLGWEGAPSPATRGRVGEGGEGVPLGRGIDGVQLLVQNPAGRLAGIGELGEIVLRTPYLALGYLGDPAATAERFTADSGGGRVYRTGDLGRYRPDGAVVFAGRADAQVKIRGFRVELGEIEAAVARHPSVREAAVILGEPPAGSEDRPLLAFVVLDPAAPPSGISDLRGWLRGQLPAYMVPVAAIPVERLPLTPNRKVDRRALAQLGTEALQRLVVETPRNPVEETLALLWGELLGLDPGEIGIHDVFFDLGGHSLLATRLLARVWDAFGVELALFRLFETPTIAGLADAVAAALRQGSAESAPLLPPVTPVPRTSLPLSFGQERLWFLHQLEPGSPAYHLPHNLLLSGPVDAGALAHAFAAVVGRHEILRTRYASVEGAPVQVIDPPGAPLLPLVDLSALPAAAREAEAAVWIREGARAPFDLAGEHPLRVRLLRLAAEDHALALTLHHIASDGWSNGLLVREVAELYRAGVAGRAAALPDLPVQYADYAAWQRNAFASGALDPQRAWWRARLGAAPPPLDLPTDRPRPAVPDSAGAWRGLTLEPELAAAAEALGRRHGATLFMTLLAAFATLLSRLTGQEDLTVGSPVAGRGRTEIEGLIGFFVNTLVLRIDRTGDPSFAELLGRVRETSLGAFVHQDVPFEKLVEELQPERDLTHPPLFQVMFVLQNTPGAALEVAGLAFRPIAADSGAATFDLTLSCAGGPHGIGGLLQYKTGLFDAPTMDRWLGHFRTLLAAAAAHPERRLDDLPLLGEAERHQLVVEGNDTAVHRAEDLCLHELFERQVERTPDAVALVVAATGEEIRYRDLDARAGRLAAWLRARGVGPEVSVGISLERSPELVVALLAVAKSGGAWVPLDPTYPPERLAFLEADAGLALLLDREGWPADLPEAPARLSAGVTPDHLAYRIYTSGSTGRPKGVLMAHRAIVQLLRWYQEELPLGPADVVLQSFSVSFDASFIDLWAPLLTGARLVLPGDDTVRDAARTAEEIVRFGVTRFCGVPPWIAELAERPELAGAAALRQVHMGGQELPAALVRRLTAPGWEVVSFYGPTEAAVIATAWTARSGLGNSLVAPLGRPIDNLRVHLLGPAAEPLPPGVAGELCIAGAGLARGYAGHPDLTADRFRPDPFGEPGTRLYRTGDRARRKPDGVLEFLGRVDRQVKVRGFRIEPGEVEAVLAAHPDLQGAAVAARRSRDGDVRLLAWAVPRTPVTVDTLRAWLAERLPEPMLPSGWVLLDALPLTPNGKVDLAALPEPERLSASGERVPPRDDLERDLAALWEELLDVRPVGIRDDFFVLGGHSLLVLRLLARIERRFGVKLPAATLFAAPTVETLAVFLRDGSAAAGPLTILAPGGDRPPLVWLHTAAGTVTAYAELARRLHEAAPDRPVWALQAPPDLPATLEELAAGHVAALRAAQPEGPYHLAGWSFGGVVAFEMAHQLHQAGAEVAPLVLVDTRAPGALEVPDDLPTLLATFAADQGLPPDLDARDVETLRPLFEAFRTHLGMLRSYRPAPYPGPIVLFRASGSTVPAPPDLGWTALAEGGLEIRELPGDHAGIIRGEGAERLADVLGDGSLT